MAACYLIRERDFNNGLYLLGSQCLQPKDCGNIVCHGHFECPPWHFFRDNSVPRLHTAFLATGGCLKHTASLSWCVPQGAGPVSLQAHVSSVPGSARLPCAGPCFMCLPSQSPPLTHEPNPSKSEISVFIIKQEWEPESQEVKNVGREGMVGFLCVKPLLTNYFKPLQDLEKPPQSLFWFS